MEPTDFVPPAPELAPDYGPPPAWPAPPPARQAKRNRLKTALGGLALAGLLVVGGAATVFAADPSPSPSTSPGVTAPGTTNGKSGTPGTHGDCPHDQTTTDTTTSTDSSS
jgi:hypothetical protein